MNRCSVFFESLKRRLFSASRRRKRRNFAADVCSVDLLENRTLLTIETLSVSADGATGAGLSNDPNISRDGRFAVFQTEADDLALEVGTDANGFQDIVVRNLVDDTTTLISRNTSGLSADDDSWAPTISDDGRFVSFASFATDLDPTITVVAGPNVFVHDRDPDQNGIYDEPGGTVTRLLSQDRVTPGFSGDGPSGGISLGAQWQYRPVISGDGRSVVYASGASNLLEPDSGIIVPPFGFPQLYVSPTDGGETILISVDPSGTAAGTLFGGGVAGWHSISANGRYVAFASSFDNLVEGDDESRTDVFLRDIFSGTTTRLSIRPDKEGGARHSREPVISRDGRHVVFSSQAEGLVEGDTNARDDIFVYSLLTERLTLVSRSRDPDSTSTTGNAASPATASTGAAYYDISDNGRYVLFSSLASDLLDPAEEIVDTNSTIDAYVFDRDADGNGTFDETGVDRTSTKLVSINADGTDAADATVTSGGSTAVSISGNGQYAVFTSPGSDLIPGVSTDTAVYLRDLLAESTEMIALSGTFAALQVGVAESGLSTSPLRVVFSSAEPDIDPASPDANGVLMDTFVYEAPSDIRFEAARTNGTDRVVVSYSISNQAAEGPFEIGVYVSEDGVFGPEDGAPIDTITLSGSDLDVGQYKFVFDIGDGPGEVALPGFGAAAPGTDYQILFVVDHLNTQTEFDSDPFNEDNTGRLSGVYHPPGGAVYVHGRDDPRFENDRIIVTEVDSATLEVRLGSRFWTYDDADVTSVEIRGHEGNDFIQAAGTADLLFGGAGGDIILGGDGDDTIYGGPDDDKLLGEAGFDTIFDGMGDDGVDLGPDGGEFIETPGSDDVLTIADGILSRLDFSFADNAITLDLDSRAVQTVDSDANTGQLAYTRDGDGIHDFTGSPFDDTITISPVDLARILRGGTGNDRVIVDAEGHSAAYDGSAITISGFPPITLIDFEEISLINAAPRIVDDSDEPGFSDTGFFDSNPNFPQGFRDGVKFSGAGQGNTATWTFNDVVPGRYLVSSTWTNAPDRASNSPFRVFDGPAGSTLVGQVSVNQEFAPDEFDDAGVSWQSLGLFEISDSTLTVQLSDTGADEFVVADAVRIEPVSPNLFLVDDSNPTFAGEGGVLTEGGGLLGSQTQFEAGAGVTVATWNFDDKALLPGPYRVSATWAPDAAAATDATFRVSHGSEEFTVTVDQTQPPIADLDIGDQSITPVPFQNLGFCADGSCNELTVTLTDDANGMVIADGIVLTPASSLEITEFDPFTGQRGLLESGGLLDLGTAAFPTAGENVRMGRTLTLHNRGIAPLRLDDIVITGPFEVDRIPKVIPVGGSASVFLTPSADLFADPPGPLDDPLIGRVTVRSDSVTSDHEFDIRATIADDTVPPMVTISSPPDGVSFVEGSTVTFDINADDDIGIQSVDLLVNGRVVTQGLSPFEIDLPFLAAEGTPPSGILSISATAVDGGGNVTTSTAISVQLIPASSSVVSISSPPGSVDPFADPFFDLAAEISGPFDIAQVEFLVDGVVVDTINQAPYVGRIPQLNEASEVTVVALDIFGTEHVSESLLLTPAVTGVSGQHWHDLNGDGIRDSGEFGLSGWTIEALNPAGQVIATTTTSGVDLNGSGRIDPVTESGLYHFDLPEGLWTIRAVPQDGWRQTVPQGEALEQLAFDLDQQFDFVATQNSFENWGGLGEKWFFSRIDRVWMYIVPDGGVFRWDGSGRENLTGTKVGQLDAGYHQNFDRVHSASPPGVASVNVISGQTTSNVDFGHRALGVIRGRVWNDLNGNGVRDMSEPWLNDWTVFLEDANGQSVGSVVTGVRDLNGDQQIDAEEESGWYEFRNLGFGSYSAGQLDRAGWTQTFPERQIAQVAYDLDRSLNLRATRNDFLNWGGLNERWFQSDDGWHFILPGGQVYKWDSSPRTALTGSMVATLSPDYWLNPERLLEAVIPGHHRVILSDLDIPELNFGNLLDQI